MGWVSRLIACFLAVASTLFTGGCATIVKGNTQDLTVTTDPSGASCDLSRSGSIIGTVNPTPGFLQVKRDGADIEISCKKRGYVETSGRLSSSFESWTFGNLFIGGIVGLAVDAGSGALHQYEPELFVKLLPEKFGSEGDRQVFFEDWRAQVLQSSAKAKIAASRHCAGEQCDELMKKIDLETQQALAGIDANRRLQANSAPSDSYAANIADSAPPAEIAGATESPQQISEGSQWAPRAGDRWHYQIVDGRRSVGSTSIEVVHSAGGRVRERFTKEGSAGFSVERDVRTEFSSRAFLSTVKLPGGYNFFELSAYFPPGSELQPGTRFGEIPGAVTYQQIGLTNLLWDTRVARMERVRVPAGEFDAWKIEADATTTTRHGTLKFMSRIWYSPAMQRAVKISLEIKNPFSITPESESYELIAFDKAN